MKNKKYIIIFVVMIVIVAASDIVEMEEVCQEDEETQEQDYSDMWEMHLSIGTRESNPPDNDKEFITNPNNYESGY